MLIFSLASLASVVAATAAFETDFPSNPLLLEDFVKTSTFNYHRKNGFIFDTAEGRFHSMSSADIAASADGEVVASARAPPGAGMSRFAFALKPSEDVFIVDTPVFRACVEAVHSVEAEGVLKHEKREQILSSLQAAGLFRFTGSGTKNEKEQSNANQPTPSHPELTETSKLAMKHFYCRRALALVAPALWPGYLQWLHEFDESIMALNHEFLDGLEKFSLLSANVITMAVKNHYDFTANPHAMKTLTAAGLSAVLEAANYSLTFEQFQRFTKAANFEKLILSDFHAWQVFPFSDAFIKPFKTLRGLYEKLLKVHLKKASPSVFFSLYNHLQSHINFCMYSIGAKARGLIDLPLKLSTKAQQKDQNALVDSLKDLLLLNKEIVADFRAAELTAFAELFETPMHWMLRGALSVFEEEGEDEDCACQTEPTWENVAALIPHEAPIEGWVDQFADYRAILKCLGVKYLTRVNEGADSPFDVLKRVSKVLETSRSDDDGNARIVYPIAVKTIVFAQLLDWEQWALIYSENEKFPAVFADFKDLFSTALDLLTGLPAEIFTDQDLSILERFDEFSEFVGHVRQLCTDAKDASKSTGLTEAEYECKVSALVRSYTASDIEGFLADAEKLIPGLVAFPHLLSREMIAALLNSDAGFKFLAEHPQLLYHLRTFEDITAEHLDKLAPRFDVERIGVGLNTFPFSLLMGELKKRAFVLNDPAAFLCRFRRDIWKQEDFKMLMLESANFVTLTHWLPDLQESEQWFNCTQLTYPPQLTTTELIMKLLNWHVNQQLRILEGLSILSRFASLACETDLPVDQLTAVCCTFDFMCGYISQEHERLMKAISTVIPYYDDDSTGRLAFKKTGIVMSGPLSGLISCALLTANNLLNSDFSPLFSNQEYMKLLFPKWIGAFDIMINPDKTKAKKMNTKEILELISKNLVTQHQKLLEILDIKELKLPEAEKANMITRLALLSLSSPAVGKVKVGESELDLEEMSEGKLPLWQAKIVARLLKGHFFATEENESLFNLIRSNGVIEIMANRNQK